MLSRLLRVTAQCLRFLYKLRKRFKGPIELEADDIEKAKILWEKMCKVLPFVNI